jgi:hypothetical protein
MNFFIKKRKLLCSILPILLLYSCDGNRNNKVESIKIKTIYQRIDSFIISKINFRAFKGASKIVNWKPDSVIFIKELNTEIYLFYRFNFTTDDWGNSYNFSVINNKSTSELFFQPYLFESIELNSKNDLIEELIPNGINAYLSSINFNKIHSISFLDTLISSLFLKDRVDLRKTDTYIKINKKLYKVNNSKKNKNVFYISNRLVMVKLLGFNAYKTNGVYMNYFKHEPKLSIVLEDVTKDFIE